MILTALVGVEAIPKTEGKDCRVSVELPKPGK